jgi:hypothetical protein
LALDLAAIEEKACARRLEELCEMQDRAIQALKNALEATQLALNTIERNRAEQGYKQQIKWEYQQPQYPQQPYYIYNNQAPPYYLDPPPSSQEKYEYNLMSKLGQVLSLDKIEVDWNIAKDNGNVNEVNPNTQASGGPL